MFAASALASFLLLAAPVGPVPEPPRTVLPGDQAALTAAGLPADGPALLLFLKRRADPDGSQPKVEDAVARLADGDKNKHGPAQVELIGYGAVALPALQRLANRVDSAEAAARARTCIGAIEGPAGGNLALAVCRAIAALRPDGVEEVLLAYLPFAESDPAFRETQLVLVGLCPPTGEAPEPFRKALKDADPLRRQAAAEILCTAQGVAAHALVRPLLEDPKTSVRLRVALALTDSYDPAAVPILIDLLASAAPAERKRIEESLTRIAGDWGFQAPPSSDRIAGELRRALWRAWWDTLSEQRLLELFRAVVQSEDDYLRWQEVLAKLNAGEAEVREKAVAELVAIGPRVLPLVRRVAGTGTPRERSLAAQAVAALERVGGPGKLPECAPRLLALRRPAGTAQVLLDGLPWLDDPLVEQQAREVLAIVALEDGKPAPVLLERLASKLPVIRAAAATALARVGGPAELARVRELLQEKDATVRLHAAVGLAQRGEKAAVPVLIDLLAALPLDRAGEAEDILADVAGDRAPSIALGSTDADRAKCKDAWLAWWKANEGKVVLEDGQRFKARPRTLILIESYDPVRRNGRIIEQDRTGRILFDVVGLSYPMHAERLGPDRVLIAEQGTGKITERDGQGRVIKEWNVPSAFNCQRLRNGNTFLAGRNQLQEVDRDGKVIWTHLSQAETILAATRYRDGQVALLTYQGTFTRLDPSGKTVKTGHVPLNTLGGVNGAEILPGDRVLCVTTGQNRVVEFDENGKIAWEASVASPQNASRQPSGSTLVTVTGGARLLEIDRTGRTVQEWKDLPVKPIRATMR